jgi:hypothetical protein
LSEFLRAAVERVRREYSDWEQFFQFVRLVQGYYPEGQDPEPVFDKIAPVFRGWKGWGTYFSDIGSDEEAYTQFVHLWKKVRYRADETPLQNAEKKAMALPLGTARGQKRPMPQYNRFVSLAGWLQVSMGDRPIKLPCREVAEVLKSTPKMVSFWRQWAIEDEYLVKVKDHTYRPGGKGEATSFRFNVCRWPILEKAADKNCGRSFDEAIPY